MVRQGKLTIFSKKYEKICKANLKSNRSFQQRDIKSKLKNPQVVTWVFFKSIGCYFIVALNDECEIVQSYHTGDFVSQHCSRKLQNSSQTLKIKFVLTNNPSEHQRVCSVRNEKKDQSLNMVSMLFKIFNKQAGKNTVSIYTNDFQSFTCRKNLTDFSIYLDVKLIESQSLYDFIDCLKFKFSTVTNEVENPKKSESNKYVLPTYEQIHELDGNISYSEYKKIYSIN